MANKETRIFTTDTLETLRQKTNDIALNLGDNEQFNASLSDKTFNYNNVSAGDTLFTGLDVLNKTLEFNIKTEQTLDNTGGYIILTGSPSITGFVADAILTQAGGYSATIVSASTDKILVKNSSGTFSSSENLVVGGDSIAASAVVRIIGEAFHIGVVRVYVNNTEISQNLLSGGFHVANYSANIPLLNSPTVTAFTEGSTVYQGTNLASATFSGTVLSASATDLKLKNHTGSFSASAVIKIDGSSSTITGANHQDISNKDTTIGNAIVLNTPATLNDDIKVYSPSLVDAVNELQDDVGITENLTTVSGNLVGAVNEIEAVFDASTHEISAGSTAFNVTSGEFTIDSSADIVLDADGGNVELKDAGTQYGSLTNSSGNIVVKSGSTTMLTGNGADATFANNVTVTQDVDVDRNLNVDGTTELNSTLGVDGNFRVGSSNTSKFDVAAATGNTQIDGTLEVDGTAGIDGDLRVGTNKFNVTASSGNTQIDGTLEVDGTAGVDGNFRVGSSGGDKFNVTAASGNTQIDGTLNVDSTTTLNGTTIDGNLDLNGSVDVSTNATIHGVLDVDGVSNLDVVDIDGAVDMALTLQVDGNTTIDGVLDIGQLNTLFTNRNDVKLALNELHTEVGSAQIGLVSGLAAYGQSNMTNAINIIDAEIGNVAAYESGTYGSTTISGVLTNLQTGMINNDTDITNLFADVGSLALVDNLPADYTYTVTDLTTATNTMSGFIGNTSIADIGTTDTVTGALQKLHAEIGDSVLTVFSEPNRNISGALRELEAEKVYLTSSSQQEIDSKLGITGNVTFKDGGSNRNKMTFNSGTTLDLSNASLLLPGNSSNVNIFSASFLEVDGNVQVQGFSVDRDHVITLTDKTDVRLQWNESHADGTSTTKPARSWQFVGLDDAAASHTTDIVTFYNAKELITNNTESGINVTWDASSETFDFNVNDPTVELSGDVVGSAVMTNLGSINISTTIQPNSVALTTDTTGDYVRTVTGTTNQITVSGAGTEGRAATFSIPTDFRAPGTVKILGTTASGSTSTGALTVAGGVGIGEDLYVAGDLYVEGNRVELNVSTLEVEDSIIVTNSLNASVGQFGLGVNNSSGNIDHSLYYNYTNNQWEADGVRILDDVNSILTPQVKTNSGSGAGNLTITDITGARDLNFIDGTGIDVRGVLSGNDINITITNTDKGSDQAIFKNFTAGSGGTATADINSDTINFPNGSQINTVRSGDTITINHANTSTLSPLTYGQAGTEDGTYVKSVTIDSNGHMTGVTTDVFDNRYDNYGSWSATDGDGTSYTLTSGDTLTFAEGTGIDVDFTADDVLTFTNSDKGSDQAIFKNFAAGSGGTATANTNNDTLTISGGTALSSVRSGDTITINHSSVGAASVNNSGVTFIQDLTIDDNGHVTETTSATVPTPGNGTVTVGAGTLLHLSANQDGIFTMNQGTNDEITINHNDVTRTDTASAATPGYAGTFTAVDSVTTSAQGHISAINLKTVTMPSAQSLPTVNNGTINLVGGVALHINESMKSFSMNQSGVQTITFDHDAISRTDTVSTASPGYAGTFTAVDSVTTSTEGHITAVNVKTVTMPSTQSSISGNAGSATILETARNFSIGGDITAASVSFNGNGAVALSASIDDNVVSNAKLADMAASTIKGRITNTGDPQDLSASQVRTMLSLANSATTTHTSADTASTIVSRDGSRNFSAGTITATLSGNASTSSQLYIDGSSTESAVLYVGGFYAGGTDGYKSARTAASIYFNPALQKLHATYFQGNVESCTGYAYSNLTGLPTIPTNNNQLTNGAGYTTFAGNTYSNNMNQYVRTTDTVQFGLVRSTGDVVAYYSDDRLKNRIGNIESALDKVNQLNGFTFTPNEESVRLGLDPEGKVRVGVSAQEVEAVLPEAVTDAPVNIEHGTDYKTVQYEKMVPLLIEAIKELTQENKSIRAELEILKSINT